DVSVQMSGEGPQAQIGVGGQVRQVRFADGQYIPVGRQRIAVDIAHRQIGLALERVLDLGEHDLAAEDPGERVTDRTFESSLEAFEHTHGRLLSDALAFY